MNIPDHRDPREIEAERMDKHYQAQRVKRFGATPADDRTEVLPVVPSESADKPDSASRFAKILGWSTVTPIIVALSFTTAMAIAWLGVAILRATMGIMP